MYNNAKIFMIYWWLWRNFNYDKVIINEIEMVNADFLLSCCSGYRTGQELILHHIYKGRGGVYGKSPLLSIIQFIKQKKFSLIQGEIVNYHKIFAETNQ